LTWQHGGEGLACPDAAKPETLASDSERETAAGLLNQAFAEGRLTAHEHGERVRTAYAARSWQQLARLTADLPAPADRTAAPEVPERRADLDRCLLCALLITCPPAGIAWLLVSRHRARSGYASTGTRAARNTFWPGGR
jgi:Domain of unknown function (DUF1707)